MTSDSHQAARARLLELRGELTEDLARAEESSRPVGLDQPIGRVTRSDAIQQQTTLCRDCQGGARPQTPP